MDDDEQILEVIPADDEESTQQATLPSDDQQQLPPLAHLILSTLAQDADASPALRDWAEHVLPNLFGKLVFHNAKGMSEDAAHRFTANNRATTEEGRAKGIRKLVEMPDQSLAVHTLNAAMGAWTVVKLANLDDTEQRLYLAGITMHDFNKMTNLDGRLQGDDAELYKQRFLEWGDALGIWKFVDQDYWPDVAFLAQNAEAVRGENRTLANYPYLKLSSALLEDLSLFVQLGDLIASIAKRPDDLVAVKKVTGLLNTVLESQYELRYHKTADNRGLLTQVIHNATLELTQASGWIPFLYFPDGVTYLAPKSSPEPSLQDVPSKIREALVNLVSDKLGQLITRAPTGMRYKSDLIELSTPNLATLLAVRRIMEIIHDKKAPVTDDRKAKTTLKDGTNITLDFDYEASLNADRLAEGLFGISKILYDFYGDNREAHGEALIRALGREDLIDTFNTINFTGGVGYPWYYIAGHYLKQHTGLRDADIEEVMEKVAGQVINDLGAPNRPPPFSFLDAYVPQTLSLGSTRTAWDFSGELERYKLNKKLRSGKHICATCNSSFEVRLDYASFSNKQVISQRADAKRGICDICRAEKLLRSFTLGRDAQEDSGVKFLHLYPTYFFTPITATAMQRAYRDFKAVTFSDVAKPYQQSGYDVGVLPREDIFQIKSPPNPKRRLARVEYPKNYLHGYFLLGVPYLGKDPSDTETWTMPALLGLLVPLLFGMKVVVSSSAFPPFVSSADFPETVILDAPHSFWQHGLKKTHFRLHELGPVRHQNIGATLDLGGAVQAALALYSLVSEAYRDGRGFVMWNQLGGVARAIESDPLAVFRYADRIKAQQSKRSNISSDGMTPWLAERLQIYYRHITDYYQACHLGGKNHMGMIQTTVDKYDTFYRARKPSAYARLRPLTLAVDAILDSPHELDDESLGHQVNGVIMAFLDRIRSRDAAITGYIPKGMHKNENLIPAVEAFSDYVIRDLFYGYCRGDRALLRKRLNLLKNGCEAYYVSKHSRKSDTAAQDTATQEEDN